MKKLRGVIRWRSKRQSEVFRRVDSRMEAVRAGLSPEDAQKRTVEERRALPLFAFDGRQLQDMGQTGDSEASQIIPDHPRSSQIIQERSSIPDHPSKIIHPRSSNLEA